MNDVLLALGKSPRARSVVRALGIPLPLPESLRRDEAALRARPLADTTVVIGGTDGAELGPTLKEALASSGADVQKLDALPDTKKVDALVFDATGLRRAEDLVSLHAFFQPLVSRLARSGRVVVLVRPADGFPPEHAAAQASVEGFVRSLAKEIGRVGATANQIVVTPGAESRAGAVLRYVLSTKSAFVTAQPIVVDARARAIADPAWVRSLEGKTALVTGAARGIGEATARALAREGAKVVCLDRPADAEATRRIAGEIGGTALLVDLGDTGAPAVLARAIADLGGVDVVVHNAGITRDKTLARMSTEQWESVLSINLAAVIHATAVLEPLIRDNGRIVCLSSIAGLAGNVGQSAYAASKAGIVGFVRREAEQLASRGITVNAIAPGFIETRLTTAIPFAIREVARRLSALGQGGLPEDVANAITFLATPGAQGITGRTLRVCGGAFVGA